MRIDCTYKSINVYFDPEANVDIANGHSVWKDDGRVASCYQLTHRNHLRLQHLDAVANETQKVEDALF